MHKQWIMVLLIWALPGLGDSLESVPIGDNVIHHHEFRSAGPWHLHVVEIDLTSSYNHLETIKAGNQVEGYARTSSMAASVDAEEHRVVAAINGDFYATGGVPVNAQVVNGMLVKREYPSRTVVGIAPDKTPFMRRIAFSGSIAKHVESIVTVNGVNQNRDTNQLIVYNRFNGSSTGTNNWGTELVATILDSALTVNQSYQVLVTAKDSSQEAGTGNNSIPADGIVISANGSAKTAVDSSFYVGDTLTVSFNFNQVPHPIWQLVGGTPRIIRNGVRSVEWQDENISSNFASDRHPRTAVGINADSTKFYFVTVDGRQPGYSVGMSLYELADYMLEWGIYQAVNLDGGGSTTMVVRGAVASSPSDAGGERSVANALLAISTAPTGPLVHLRVSPDGIYTLVETSVAFSVAGFDATYNPAAVPEDSLQWSCDSLIGSIDSNGQFQAAENEAVGYVVAHYGDIVDSALVTVTDIANIELTPDPLILAVGESQQIIADSYDGYGNRITLAPSNYEWSVEPAIGQISGSGFFLANAAGIATITATYRHVSGHLTANIGDAFEVVQDDFTTLDNWSLSGVVVDLGECDLGLDSSTFVSAPSSARLDYSLVQGGVSALYLNGSVLVSGTPEAVTLHVYGDSSTHWLRGEFQDHSGDRFLVNFTETSPGIDWVGWRELMVELENAIPHWGNPAAILDFPITWTKIYLAEIDENKKDSGSIYFDDLGFHFIGTGIKGSQPQSPEGFKLEGPYPNPFNAGTRFDLTIFGSGVLQLEIFSITGELVWDQQLTVSSGELKLSWDPAGQGSGVYLYRSSLGSSIQTGKLTLLR